MCSSLLEFLLFVLKVFFDLSAIWVCTYVYVLYLCVCVSVFGCIVWACPNSLFFSFQFVASELRLLSCFITSVSFIYILMHFAKQFFKMYHLWIILHIAWINSTTTKKQKSFKSPINCMYFKHSDCFCVLFFELSIFIIYKAWLSTFNLNHLGYFSGENIVINCKFMRKKRTTKHAEHK